jgi:hypothetical protein
MLFWGGKERKEGRKGNFGKDKRRVISSKLGKWVEVKGGSGGGGGRKRWKWWWWWGKWVM